MVEAKSSGKDMNDIDDTEPSKFDEDCSVLSVSHQHLQDDFSRSSTPPPSLGGVHEVKTNNSNCV